MKNRELNEKELEQAAGGHAEHAQVKSFTGPVKSAGSAYQLGDQESELSRGQLESFS